MAHIMPLGISEFKEIREGGSFYVDKSRLISEIIGNRSKAILLPRPRRFGKTLNLTMLREFFSDGVDHRHLFQGLAVADDAEAMTHLGAYPTIYITFKDLKFESWDACQRQLRVLVQDMFDPHWERIKSSDLAEHKKSVAYQIVSGQADLENCQTGLLLLSRLLHGVSGKRVMILVDEYDSPIHAGHQQGFRDKIVGFMRHFLGGGLKDNPVLEKGVLTGILRVAKDSIFSGLNNLKVYTLLDTPFAAHFGFSEAEVQPMLAFAGMSDRTAEVQRWYNGYRFGPFTMYNPWSILSILSEPKAPFVAHWINTADNQMIRDLVAAERAISLGDLTRLLEGDTVTRQVDAQVAFNDLRPESVWGLMLLSGYLTIEDTTPTRANHYRLRIPNLEVRTFFESTVSHWLGTQNQVDELLASLLVEDMNGFAERLAETVAQVLSYHDTASDSERVYHVFLAGLLVHLRASHEIISNREAGFGRYDLVLIPRQQNRTGFVFEFKRAKDSDLNACAQTALKQIIENDYAAALRERGILQIRQIGLAFDGKRVALASALATSGASSSAEEPITATARLNIGSAQDIQRECAELRGKIMGLTSLRDTGVITEAIYSEQTQPWRERLTLLEQSLSASRHAMSPLWHK